MSAQNMVQRLADVIVNYSTAVQPGELVVIESDPIAMPLIAALTESVLAAGGQPQWYARSEALEDVMMHCASPQRLEACSPIDRCMIDAADVRIALWAEVNTRAFASVDPVKQRMRSASRRPLLARMIERCATGEMRWCGTLYPTQASAQDAQMSLRQYEQFVYQAGKLHLQDPIAAWRAVQQRQEIVRDWLQGKSELRFHVPPHNGHDGTDLRVDVSGGTWINCCGERNFPDGEVFAGPQGADGFVNYTYPALLRGRAAEGVRLEFRSGRVIDARAQQDEAFLIEMLDQDEGARTMGEIAIGTNYDIRTFSRNTLFDEKIGGTFHAAVGAGSPESGSHNVSGLHWDMVCELRPDAARGLPGGTIEADGEVFSRDGKLMVPGW